jgi:hypothetical protein
VGKTQTEACRVVEMNGVRWQGAGLRTLRLHSVPHQSFGSVSATVQTCQRPD